MKKLPLAVLLLTLYAGISGCNDRPDRQSLQNIEAFARMYGLVRRFHPSDEAQRVDWNRFALYGVERVAACESTEELERELERLFRRPEVTRLIKKSNDFGAAAARTSA